MRKVISEFFLDRPGLQVAENLLGKFLVIKNGNDENALMINEVEVYDGFEDRASHAYRGRTKRNNVMFGPAGFWYVYLVYGMYWMLNIVTGPKDYPAAILIRGAGQYNGPGKLSKALGIDGSFNEKKAGKKCGLWIEERCVVKGANSAIHESDNAFKIKRTPRIGVNYAGPIWSKKAWRFVMEAP